MDRFLIKTEEEYNMVVSSGYQPLLNNRFFRLDIDLRETLQKRIFGHCAIGRGRDIMAANDRFFHWIWDHKPHYCEECMRPLHDYSAVYCSHILTRGAHPEIAHDPRNVNILCFRHHNQWENGDKKSMRIYPGNMRIIDELLEDYNVKRK